MPGRSFSSNSYRFGYQGSEKDDEISGEGNNITTEFRQLDTRLLRWWSVDPKASQFPGLSPYMSMDGNPVKLVDPDGLSPDDVYLDKEGNEEFRVFKPGEDRYFAPISEPGSGVNYAMGYAEVNSPNTLKGDPKSRNPWNGKTEKIDAQELIGDVATDAMNVYETYTLFTDNPVLKTFGAISESMQGGDLDYVDDFKDGVIYDFGGTFYNSHEALNLKWGSAMKVLNFSEKSAVFGAKAYHFYAFSKDKVMGGIDIFV
jgi:RHS repeat-associated protein